MLDAFEGMASGVGDGDGDAALVIRDIAGFLQVAALAKVLHKAGNAGAGELELGGDVGGALDLSVANAKQDAQAVLIQAMGDG